MSLPVKEVPRPSRENLIEAAGLLERAAYSAIYGGGLRGLLVWRDGGVKLANEVEADLKAVVEWLKYEAR